MTADKPPLPQVCHRCQQLTDRPVLVKVVHGASLGGRNVYACPGCAPLPRKARP